jgi:hypothetical protein
MIARFLSRGTLQAASDVDDGKWRVVDPLIYESVVAQRTITVPTGFVTDLASVPRLPVVYLACGDCASEAAIVHDYLYSTGLVPRRVADDVLFEASKVSGVPAWRRWAMWAGVRLGGASHFNAAATP